LVTEDLPERSPRPGLHRYAVLARHLPPADSRATWLDLGGGAGEFSLLVRKQGYDVTLVDGDPRNIANVATLGIRPLLADLNQPLEKLADASFDGVSLVEVVEHIPMAEQLMRESYRVLKPGGLLLLSTPNAVWWRERIRILFGREPQAEGYHYRYLSVSGVRSLCMKSGFEIRRVEFSSPAFGLNWIRRHVLRRGKRKHVSVARPFAGLFAQTVYVVGRKP
jgi:SAM-dependent methyltransferase